MPTYGVAQARKQLSALIDMALAGESVVITRYGRPVVELKALGPKGRAMTREDIETLRARRVILTNSDPDPRSVVERMRDEDDERLLRR